MDLDILCGKPSGDCNSRGSSNVSLYFTDSANMDCAPLSATKVSSFVLCSSAPENASSVATGNTVKYLPTQKLTNKYQMIVSKIGFRLRTQRGFRQGSPEVCSFIYSIKLVL